MTDFPDHPTSETPIHSSLNPQLALRMLQPLLPRMEASGLTFQASAPAPEGLPLSFTAQDSTLLPGLLRTLWGGPDPVLCVRTHAQDQGNWIMPLLKVVPAGRPGPSLMLNIAHPLLGMLGLPFARPNLSRPELGLGFSDGQRLPYLEQPTTTFKVPGLRGETTNAGEGLWAEADDAVTFLFTLGGWTVHPPFKAEHGPDLAFWTRGEQALLGTSLVSLTELRFRLGE